MLLPILICHDASKFVLLPAFSLIEIFGQNHGPRMEKVTFRFRYVPLNRELTQQDQERSFSLDRTEEGRTRQTLCDKCDNNFV